MIPAIQAYSKAAGTHLNLPVRRDNAVPNKFDVEVSKTKANEPVKATLSAQSVISPAERDFFKGLFPENAAQIERHVVFNRTGQLSVGGVEKGSLFDGRG
ncbi:MAG: hypothetical protein HYZ54_10850 [Ignavibacteriae bacterium]|nr:hypothetical protein [Ignavibacteriota bacterium]